MLFRIIASLLVLVVMLSLGLMFYESPGAKQTSPTTKQNDDPPPGLKIN